MALWSGPPLRALALAALVALLLPYLISGVQKLRDFAGARAEVAGLGLRPAGPLAAAVIATQLGGSLLLLAGGRWAWLGGVALAAFTLAATLAAHGWWRLPPGAERRHAFTTFWEHLALVGALLYVAATVGAVR